MNKENVNSFNIKRAPFTQLSNPLLHDKNISTDAKGLYMTIRSYITIPDFKLHKSFLMKQRKGGEKAFNSDWNELKQTGYLKQYKQCNKGSKGFTYEYELLDIPVIDDEDKPSVLKVMNKSQDGTFKIWQVPFTQVPNTVVRDINISSGAKGLYGIIQSYITIPNFKLYKSFLMTKCKEGEKAFNRMWNELKKTGYLKQDKKWCANSKHFIYEYKLLQVPVIDEGRNVVKNLHVQNRHVKTRANNNTDINNTNHNNTKVKNINSNNTNLSQSIASYQSNRTNRINFNVEIDTVRNDKISEEKKQDNINLLKFNINPDNLIEVHPNKKAEITEIFNLMSETVNSGKPYITIAKEGKPIEIIRNIFFKLDGGHIEYILDSLDKNTTKIRNPKAYLLTTIYNSYFTYTNAGNMTFNNTYKDDPYMQHIMGW